MRTVQSSGSQEKIGLFRPDPASPLSVDRIVPSSELGLWCRRGPRVNPREKVTETPLAHSVRNVTRQGSCAGGHDELLGLHGRLSSGRYGRWTTRSCRVRCRLSPFGLQCGQCLGCPLAHMVWQCCVRRSCLKHDLRHAQQPVGATECTIARRRHGAGGLQHPRLLPGHRCAPCLPTPSTPVRPQNTSTVAILAPAHGICEKLDRGN